jgi:hypothetical protein
MPCGSYTSDLTSGQTFSASGTSSGYEPSKAFDDNTSTYWYYIATSVWIQVQFSEAKAIARATVRNVSSGSTSPSAITIKGSNTGSFSGEEAELYSTSGLSWSNGETKTFDFDNENTYTHYRLYMTVSFGPQISEIALMECAGTTYQNTSTDGGKFGDAASADFKNRGEISDIAGIGDAVEGYDFKGELSDAAGIADAIAAESEIDVIAADAAGIADAVDAFSLSDSFSFAVEIGDEADAGFERAGDLSDAAEIGDAADALNWTEWVRTYRDSAVARFYCTLTGAADGLADIELPISSFQARKRQGESNFLSVIVPGMAYAEAVAARSNGDLYIEMAYLVNGEATIREEIIRVEDLEINIYEGASSRSINLSGYREATYVAKNASISGSNYKYTMSGRRGFRFPQADPYLNPGDTLTIEDTDDELTVDQISYVIAARGLKQMEVRE